MGLLTTEQGSSSSFGFFTKATCTSALGVTAMLTAFLAFNLASGGSVGILLGALAICYLIHAALATIESGTQLAINESMMPSTEHFIDGCTSLLCGSFLLACTLLLLSGGPAIALGVFTGIDLVAGVTLITIAALEKVIEDSIPLSSPAPLGGMY